MSVLVQRFRGIFREGNVEFDLPEDLQFRGYDGRIVRRLLQYIRPYGRQMLLALLLMAVITATSLAGPYIIKLIMDNAIAQGNITLLHWLIVAFIAANLIGWLARSPSDCGGRGGPIQHLRRAARSVREVPATIDELLRSGRRRRADGPHDLGRERAAGAGDVGDRRHGFRFLHADWHRDRHAQHGLAAVAHHLLGAAPHVYLDGHVARPTRDNWRRVRFYNGRMLGYIEENIQGVRVVQAFTRENHNLNKFVTQINHRFNRAQIRAARLSAIFFPGVDFLGTLSVALVIGFGGSLVFGSNAFTAGRIRGIRALHRPLLRSHPRHGRALQHPATGDDRGRAALRAAGSAHRDREQARRAGNAADTRAKLPSTMSTSITCPTCLC